MADHDRNSDTIIGRDADAGAAEQVPVDRDHGFQPDDLADPLNQAAEDAEGNAGDVGANAASGEFEIVFEFEEDDETLH